MIRTICSGELTSFSLDGRSFAMRFLSIVVARVVLRRRGAVLVIGFDISPERYAAFFLDSVVPVVLAVRGGSRF